MSDSATGLNSALEHGGYAAATRRRVRIPGWVVVAFGALVIALVPLLFNHRFYYTDDTQTYSVGIWSDIGHSLLTGHLSWIRSDMWVAGNHALDAQHGLWSPVILAISVLAALSSNLGVFATALKIFWLVFASVGVYLLARTYMRTRWAIIAGMAAPLNGVTSYMDAPSWTVLLITFALLAFLWWALRRIEKFSALPACVFGVLIAGLGFAQSIIMAAIVIFVVLIDMLLRRRWRLVWQVAITGAVTMLFAVSVFLPGFLSSGVTFRDSSGIGNDEIMRGSLSTLGMAQFPTALPQMTWSWGTVAPVPFAYIIWTLALVPLVPWREVWRVRRTLLPIGLAGLLTLALLLGPSLIGPTRMPFRYYPLLALIVILILNFGFSTADQHGWKLTRRRVLIIVGIVIWGAFAAFSNAPTGIRALTIGLVVTSLACAGTVWAIARKSGAVPFVIVTGLTLVAVAQHAVFPAAPVYDFSLPSARSDFQSVQSKAIAPTVVVGTLRFGDGKESGYTKELLLGNSWLLSQAGAQNLYSSLGRKGYTDTLCIDFLGQSCPSLLTHLFSRQPTTDMLLVDQLGINTIIVTSDVADQRSNLITGLASDAVPAGWHVADTGKYTQTWVRDTAASCTDGGVVWTSDGVSASLVSAKDDSITVRVNTVPDSGGTIAFCRMQWPGFRTSDDSEVLAIDGYLLGVGLNRDAVGRDVTISYELPGARIVYGSLIAAVTLTLGSVVLWISGRRRRAGHVNAPQTDVASSSP